MSAGSRPPPLCASISTGAAAKTVVRKIFFISVSLLLFDCRQIGGDVVHVLVIRIVQLEKHLLMSLLRILHFHLRLVVLERERLPRAVRELKHDEEIIVAHQPAFELLTVRQRHGSLHPAATAAPASAATAARDPGV